MKQKQLKEFFKNHETDISCDICYIDAKDLFESGYPLKRVETRLKIVFDVLVKEISHKFKMNVFDNYVFQYYSHTIEGTRNYIESMIRQNNSRYDDVEWQIKENEKGNDTVYLNPKTNEVLTENYLHYVDVDEVYNYISKLNADYLLFSDLNFEKEYEAYRIKANEKRDYERENGRLEYQRKHLNELIRTYYVEQETNEKVYADIFEAMGYRNVKIELDKMEGLIKRLNLELKAAENKLEGVA